MLQMRVLKVIFVFLYLLSIMKANGADIRIYQQDNIGSIQYNKPSAVIEKDGRIIQTDSIGNKQNHKKQYIIKKGNIYQTDSIGNIQYHKPQAVIK
jgi:hypothetical protein